MELFAGSAALLFGLGFGLWRWWGSLQTGIPVTAGTVMLAALPVLVGVQLLLAFLNYDVRNVPHIPLHQRLLPTERSVSKRQKVPRNPVGLPASPVSR